MKKCYAGGLAWVLAMVIVAALVPANKAEAQVKMKGGDESLFQVPEQLQPKEVEATLSPDITIMLDGEKLELLNAKGEEVAPILLNGTTMLPVRALSYAFGRYITLWSQSGGYFAYTGRATSRKIYMTLDMIYVFSQERTATEDPADYAMPRKTVSIIDKTPKQIIALSDPAAYVIDFDYYERVIGLKDAGGNQVYPLLYEGTYYVPIRATAALFGCNVAWDGANRTVVLATTPAPPLFAGEEYISSRYPTQAEKDAFDSAVTTNKERNERFIKWLDANTDAIVRYTTSHYGGWLNVASTVNVYSNDDFVPYGEAYSTSYGAYATFGDEPVYESEPIESLAKTLIGGSDRETARNIFDTVLDLLQYEISGYHSQELATLSGDPPYGQNCSGGAKLITAMMRAAGIPAIEVEGYRSSSSVPHAWVACYMESEKRWIFCDWTSDVFDFDLTKEETFIREEVSPNKFERRPSPRYKVMGVEIPGVGSACNHLLETSYYLNYVE
jgi:hypothetical protein